MPRDIDPSTYQVWLRTELRDHRGRRGVTQEHVADELNFDRSTFIRKEMGRAHIEPAEAQRLAEHYGCDEATVRKLVAYAHGAKGRPWFAEYKVKDPKYAAYLGHEAAATSLRIFQSEWIPGLIQTETYARALLPVVTSLGGDDLDRAVQLRMARQARLASEDPPVSRSFLIAETALRRCVGSAEVMREQLGHLRDRAGDPQVTIRVVPFGVPAVRGALAPYVLLTQEGFSPNVLYLETPDGDRLVEEDPREQVPLRQMLSDRFDSLVRTLDEQGVSAAELIDRALRELS